MKVTISVAGRFHAFYLAQQLLKRGYLKKIITSYPKFEVKKYGIPKYKVNSVIIKELMFRGWQKMPGFIKQTYNPQYLVKEIFDKKALKKVDECDIFVGWSSNCLHSLKKAKELGAVTIVERGSSHMLYQQQILKEEYEKYGLPFNKTHPKVVEKELKEYKEADYISVPSKFVKKSFLDKDVSKSKLLHIPFGVDLSEFKQIPKKDNIFRVVTVGGNLQKGTHYLLQAFNELDLPYSELMGLGKLSQEMLPFIKKYNKNINWIGHKPQRELYKYYSQGTIYIHPSIQDGFGMVIPQSMSCGLPVITTTNTGGGDIIENGKEGFIIPIRNINALKEKILYFYENPEECIRMGQAAKRKVQNGFTWDDYGERIIEEYKNILND
ncbi:MAG: glycosyltransferase family 4 protein [Atribacterota bacterium]